MPVARSTSTADLVESFSQPNDFDGTILEVIAAPHDSGALFTGAWKETRWGPINLGLYFHYQPDNEDAFWAVVSATNWGKLGSYISATGACDPDAMESDIEYPGSPVCPDGLDMDLMEATLEDLWNSDAIKGDVGLYQQAMRDRWGGHQPFHIGRERDHGLPKDTNWDFYITTVEKDPNFRDVVEDKFSKDSPSNPNQLLRGFRGHFERLVVPQQGKKKKSAMREDDDKETQRHP